MNEDNHLDRSVSAQEIARPKYVDPVVRVMDEAEVLSAFQVNAAGTMAWWVA